MFQNCRFFTQDFFQKLFTEWKPYMANVFCKKMLLFFQVEIEKNCYKNLWSKGLFLVLRSTDQATPDQLKIPLDKLP